MRELACGTGQKGPGIDIAHVIFSLLFTVFFFFSAGPAEGVTVRKVEIKGLSSIGREEFLNMFGIREGKQVNAELVREAIKRAFLKGIFDDIQVRVPDGENPVVEVTVKERDFIRKVSISGKSALSAKQLRTLFILKEGDVMRYDLIGTAIRDLGEKVAKYGYPEARISVDTEKTDQPYRVNVRMAVDTGIPLIVKNVKLDITPPNPLLEAEGGSRVLYDMMKMKAGDIYDQHRVDQDMKRLRSFLKKRGFYRPVVGPYSYHNGDLDLAVNPGRHLTISIAGNEVIATKKLMKEIPFFDFEDYNDELVQEAVDRMLSLYHGEGYPFAEIAPLVSSDEYDVKVSFFIYEGARVKVHSITFLHAGLPEESLKEVMSLKEGGLYNPGLVEQDKGALNEFYAALGYLDATIKSVDVKVDKTSDTASVTIDVDEGKKTVIGSVDVTGVDEAMKQKLLTVAALKTGSAYNDVDISDARFRLLEYLTSSGRANADVVVKRDVEDYKAAIVFQVTEGKKEFFGKTIITGNRMTKYEVIRRELQYREGDPYSPRVLAGVRQRLYRLALFSSVDVEAIDGGNNRKDILIKVSEGEPGSIEFGFGYGDYEKFRGFVQIGYDNLWGTDRKVVLRTELSSLQRRVILQYNEPWFMGINLPFRTFFLYEFKKELNQDSKDVIYKLNRYSVTSGVEKQLSPRMKGELYYQFDVVNTTDVAPDVILSREDTGTLAISSIKPALVFDTRDNPFDPKKGIIAGISVKATSLLLLSQTNFVKMELYASNFQKLSNRVVLAVDARGGVAYGYHKTNELPIVERFFLGGRSTVRGYAQDTLGPKGADGNPTGGNAYLMGNVELRTSIGKGFSIVPFLDMGNVWVKANQMNPMKLKYTTGLGLRYSTPVGPLRVDYGYKLDREQGESHGEIHFSIGQAF
jgi:outer membrane protein insertion porin family